jgi:hypothetical protein
MGDVKLTKADYIVGTQTIDVLTVLNKLKAENYGAIELSVSKLDAILRKDNRISTPPDAEALKLTPPRLVVDYTDEDGIPHHIDKTGSPPAATALPPQTAAKETFDGDGEDTVAIGKRSLFGKLIQTPMAILKDMGSFAARGSFLFALGLFWAVVVIWTYTQWSYIGIELTPNKGAAWNPIYYTNENYGFFSKYVISLTALIVGGLAALCTFTKLDELIPKFVGVTPVYGWLMRGLMTISSGVAPIAGFFLQLMIWVTVVRPIEGFKKNPTPNTFTIPGMPDVAKLGV